MPLGVRYPVVLELVEPVEDVDPMFGQLCPVDDDVPEELVEPLLVVVVVVAANDAKPTARRVATVTTARTAMRRSARLLGNDRMLGMGIELLLYSISCFFTSRQHTIGRKQLIANFRDVSLIAPRMIWNQQYVCKNVGRVTRGQAEND